MIRIILFICFAVISFDGFSKIWTVTNNGSKFSPETLQIIQGDTVRFSLASAHNALEVSESTWKANGNEQLTNGFSTDFGGGDVLPSKLSVGTHWFVCQPHAAFGMKGVIIVQNTTSVKNTSKNSISVFPNPAKDYIKVVAANLNDRYEIIDPTGKRILSGILSSNENLISIGNLHRGIYFLRVGNELFETFKFEKE